MTSNEKQSTKIRVIQIIDSLEAGGGERMAVNLANALEQRIEVSGLMVTRKEGLLKSEVNPNVKYSFVNKQKTIDLKALKKAKQFIKDHQITHLHAHSTSFFFATLLKLMRPGLKLIWHDHNGNRSSQNRFQSLILKFCSFHFDSILVVNDELKTWAKKNLFISKVQQVNNFILLPKHFRSFKHPKPFILMVANLRTPKNHIDLIKAYKKLENFNSVFDLLLVGKFSDESYVKKLKQIIKDSGLGNKVIFLGQRNDIFSIIKSASLTVLSSTSEGLPLVLIEYAMVKKSVVVTDVGQCKQVVGDYAKLVPKGDPQALADAIEFYLSQPDQAAKDAELLHQRVVDNYGEDKIIEEIIEVY